MERHAYWLPVWCKTHDVPRTKAYQEIEAGRLITFKIGKRRFITAAESLRYFSTLERQAREMA